MERQTIKVPIAIYKQLRDEAAKRGCFIWTVVRDALAIYFLQQMKGKLKP